MSGTAGGTAGGAIGDGVIIAGTAAIIGAPIIIRPITILLTIIIPTGIAIGAGRGSEFISASSWAEARI